MLAEFDIADKSSECQLLGVLLHLDYPEGKYDAALMRTTQIRALQEKAR